MRLVYENRNFAVECNSAENEICERVGLSFDRKSRTWQTPFYDVAVKLSNHLSPPEKENLVIARNAEEQTRLKSRGARSGITIPAPLGLGYLDFQKAGIEYMATRPMVLLADEMGLGKTIQAIGLINHLLTHEIYALSTPPNCLVVCPASLRRNWEAELTKWLVTPLSIGIATTKSWPTTNVVIINYDILNKWHDKTHAILWDFLFLDECHYLKNSKAKRTKEVLG